MKNLLVTLIAFFAAVAASTAQTDTTTLTRVGDKAPAFTCKTVDGKTIDIRKLKGKIIMVNFFATWCGPCNSELPVLQSNIWDKYKNRNDFVLIIIGRNHTEKEVAEFAESRKFTMPFAPDPNREIFGLYATQSIPRNVVIGKDGRIIFQGIGYTEQEFRELENFLADKLK